jgi:energy-coupling factor transporter ATP-binding protein EcfA2
MYIDKVRLTNIRGFRDLEFSFDRGNGTYAGWTVLTGDNGSGKSTLLKAVALALSYPYRVFLQPSLRGWLRTSEAKAHIELQTVESSGSRDMALIEIERPTRAGGMEMPDTLGLGKFPANTDEWFCCGYGPFRRISGVSKTSKDVPDLMGIPVVERLVTLFQETASLVEADRWLRDLNYKKLEGKNKAAETLAIVINLLNEEFLPNQIKVERVDSDGLWLKDREGNELSWSDMSDGYRSALALLTDMLRHLINHYGIDDLTARDAEGKLFITRSGVVLIDEIDAHLHPEWQREIGFWLKKRFPNIQFIVTSHSPLICQAADPNGLFVLPEPGSDEPARALTPEEYQEVITSKSDTILRSSAFGLRNTRSDMVVEKRARYSRLQSRLRQLGSLPEPDQQELVELSRYINPDEEP